MHNDFIPRDEQTDNAMRENPALYQSTLDIGVTIERREYCRWLFRPGVHAVSTEVILTSQAHIDNVFVDLIGHDPRLLKLAREAETIIALADPANHVTD